MNKQGFDGLIYYLIELLNTPPIYTLLCVVNLSLTYR